MGNMSYCRFQNTALDLSDCYDALQELIGGDSDTGEERALSDEEQAAAEQLISLCMKIVALVADDDDVDLGDPCTMRKMCRVIMAANQRAKGLDEEGSDGWEAAVSERYQIEKCND